MEAPSVVEGLEVIEKRNGGGAFGVEGEALTPRASPPHCWFRLRPWDNGLSATKSLTNRPVGLSVLSNEQDQQSESYASEDP
jgi:hypothetical protein